MALIMRWDFLGLSTDSKPTTGEKVTDGSTFFECDTSKLFIFYKDQWYEIFPTSE